MSKIRITVSLSKYEKGVEHRLLVWSSAGRFISCNFVLSVAGSFVPTVVEVLLFESKSVLLESEVMSFLYVLVLDVLLRTLPLVLEFAMLGADKLSGFDTLAFEASLL